jgi:hypothetical protein
LFKCIDVSERQAFNPNTVSKELMVKYAQYGFKSLEKYALQTLAVVQEFVVMKVFYSMYYETQDNKAGDMSAFKENCDSYIWPTPDSLMLGDHWKRL